MHVLRLASLLILSLGCALAPAAHAQAAKAAPAATSVRLGNVEYLHRWSQAGQNEYTSKGQEDLAHWRDMVTIDVHASAHDGDQLAAIANGVLGNYQKAGQIIRTDSRPRTPTRPAEHLIVALLAGPQVMEAAFARVVLVEGTGCVVVYSHRAYGKERAAQIGQWLQANGPTVEKTLMEWRGVPKLADLRRLPQSR